MDVHQLLERVKGKVIPSDEERERLIFIYNMVVDKLSPFLDGVELRLMGSLAKNTFVKGEGDIDIFAIFPDHVDLNDAVDRLFKAVEKVFGKYEKAYANHPYVRFYIDNVKVEIVPSYLYKGGKPKTAVDRTQKHVEYILSHLKDEQREEVILLKAFLKNLGLYGAEIKVEGFSGYLCELLILKYGSFLNLIENAARWKFPKVIEPCYCSGKFPLIFADPVDKTRNVASPLSWKNARLFSSFAKAFLNNPSEEFFFFDKRVGLEGWKALLFKSPGVVEDIKWGQLKRIGRAFEGLARSYSIDIVWEALDDGVESAIAFFHSPIGFFELREGPFVNDLRHLGKFVEGAFTYYVDREGRIKAIKERRVKKMEDLVELFNRTKKPSYYEGEAKLVSADELSLKNRYALERKLALIHYLLR